MSDDLIKRLRLQLIKRLRDEHLPMTRNEAADYIEQLEESNKELTLQLLATSGQAADALDKLAKAVERLRNIRELNMTAEDENGHQWANSDLIEQEIVTVLAELEGK